MSNTHLQPSTPLTPVIKHIQRLERNDIISINGTQSLVEDTTIPPDQHKAQITIRTAGQLRTLELTHDPVGRGVEATLYTAPHVSADDDRKQLVVEQLVIDGNAISL